MPETVVAPTPITILTGFLGSGKTTLILNLLPQLPSDYKLALLKNEFGDVAIDTELASRSSIAGVQELLNGCICCNLVGQLGDALQTLRNGVETSRGTQKRGGRRPDRIVIETSGSAFPATLAMEVNRLASETGYFSLDGVVSVIDVENWQGYEDTSVTAKMQARYTDLIILNKWEYASERRLDDVLDRIGDLELDPPVPTIKSKAGKVDSEAILGLDSALARQLDSSNSSPDHSHDHSHVSEVEVISATLQGKPGSCCIELNALQRLIELAPKDEIYRIKAVLCCIGNPKHSGGDAAVSLTGTNTLDQAAEYILNWAFGRWSFTLLGPAKGSLALRMTIVTARYESSKWLERIGNEKLLRLADDESQLAILVRQV